MDAVRCCSTPGCRREAKPDDTLCGLCRGGRTRSANARAKRPNRLAAPGIPEAIRRATIKEVLEKMHGMPSEYRGFGAAWDALEAWLKEQESA